MSAQTVLVVEDEPTLRETVVAVLRAEGYRVAEAADGAEALQVMQGAAVAPSGIGLVVLDLMLPEVSGLEVLRQLPTLGVQVPVVATSVSPPHLVAAADAGATAVLPKPINLDVLLSIVGRSCARRAAASSSAPMRLLPRRTRRWSLARLRRRTCATHAPCERQSPRRRLARALQHLQYTVDALELELNRLDAELYSRAYPLSLN